MGDLALPFVVAVPAYLVIGFTIFDAVRRADLKTPRKVMWVAAAVLLPIFGTLLYLLNRPFRDPGHGVSQVNPRTIQLVALLERHESGAIEDAEFAQAKQRIFQEARESRVPNTD